MTDGIYIVGNDRYGDQVRALVNSIRHFDPAANICLIPYDDKCEITMHWLMTRHGIGTYPDEELLENITTALDDWFDYPGSPVQRDKRNRLRNLAAWCGPYDRFVCLDADILVFESIVTWCDQLVDCDLLACDDLHRHGGKWVFTPAIESAHADIKLSDVFNGGFWVSKRGLLNQNELFSTLDECRRYREYFDFPNGALAQPFINYIAMTRTQRRRNLIKEQPDIRVWIGDPGLHERKQVIWHGERRCPFLHWAGKPFEPGKFFYDTWLHYRDMVA